MPRDTPIINDDPSTTDTSYPPGVSFGLVPRDYTASPPEMFQPPSEIGLIPESEWDARIDEQEAQQSSLEHIFLRADQGKPFVNLDQDGDGYCVPPGTLIRMADGSQKPIQDVKLLEAVLTAEGNVGRVMQCHVRDHTGEMVTVKTWGHGHLRLTPNHSVLTSRGYVSAGDLAATDFIAIPRYAPQRSGMIQTSEHVVGVRRRVANAADGSASFVARMPAATDRCVVRIPDFIRLTPGAGRIFGLWLAEGHIDDSTRMVYWSFNATETDTLASELAGLLRSEWGVEARTQPGPASPDTVVQVVISGVLWCQLFASLCGRGAGTKRVHADLMSGPREFLEGLFCGWMAGDGCVRHANVARGYDHQSRVGATISHALAMSMYDIANALGLCPTMSREKPQVNRHAKTRQPVWKVHVNLSPSSYRPNFRVMAEDTRVWRKVRAVEREAYSGTVYNLGVEGDNSYVAEGVGVHNCWAYSTGHALMLLRAAMNQPLVRLNPHATAAIIKKGRDDGGWCGLSAKWARETGYAVEGNGPGQWPLHSRDLRYDTPELRDSMALHQVGEDWVDLTRDVYDQNLTVQMLATLLLSNIPCPVDFNWWGHSVCAVRWVRFERGSYGPRILNSWKGWGRFGLGDLQGSKGVPNGALGVRVTGASPI